MWNCRTVCEAAGDIAQDLGQVCADLRPCLGPDHAAMVKLTGAIDQLRTAHDGMCKMFGIEPSQPPSPRAKTRADVYAHLSIALGILNSILGEIGCRELCVARESLLAARKALFPRAPTTLPEPPVAMPLDLQAPIV